MKFGQELSIVKGNSQPMVLAQWNPGGYINNACHRVNVYGV